MFRSLIALVAVATLAGCVSVSAPSAAPSATPTLDSTTMPPSSPPTATPTPSEAVTAAPTPTSSMTPGPTDSEGFDTRDLLFNDELTDSTSGWSTGPVIDASNAPVGAVAYDAGGTLRLDVVNNGGWLWTRRSTGSNNAALRVVGDFTPSGPGAFGLLCALGEGELIGAVVSTTGAWAFVSIENGVVTQLVSEADGGLPVPVGESTILALECTGTATGALRMQLWLGGVDGPVGMYESAAGPASFDRAVIYAEAAIANFALDVQSVVAFGVTGADGQPNADGQALLAHVPLDWRSKCNQAPVPTLLAARANTLLVCFLGAPGDDRSEIAEYAAYSGKADMDAAYQARVDNFVIGNPAVTCADGSPGERAYKIGDIDAGRVLCAPQFNGTRMDWTDDRLNIMSTLVDFDGSYGRMFLDWNVAGPNL